METVEIVKKLRRNVNSIRNLFLQKIPKWKAEPKTYDKTSWGFEERDNDGWYKDQAITLHFSSWAGTYGDSSVYKQIDLDGDIFRKHFMAYLNNNKESIMLAVADSIEKEAKTLVDKASSELNKQLESIKELQEE
jgi:hypothetical protein